MKASRLFLMLLVGFAGCNEQNNTPQLAAIKQLSDIYISDSTKAIVILNDGNCPACNQKFINFMASYQARKDILFIIATSKSAYDYADYDFKQSNVYEDRNKALSQTGLFTGSTIIFLKASKQDTLMSINVNNLNAIQQYIRQAEVL